MSEDSCSGTTIREKRERLEKRLYDIKQEQAAICTETEAIRARLHIVEGILADVLLSLAQAKAIDPTRIADAIDKEVVKWKSS